MWHIIFLKAKEGIEPQHQRWFFGGKLLGDKLHIDEARILPSYVIQVIINPEPTNDSWILYAIILLIVKVFNHIMLIYLGTNYNWYYILFIHFIFFVKRFKQF